MVIEPGTPPADPEDERILAQFGLTADKWEISAYRESRWEQTPCVELSAYRVSVRRKVNPAASLDENAISAILSSYPARPTRREPGQGVLCVPVADLQIGKHENGGTAAIVDRFARVTGQVRDRIDDQFGRPW